MNNELVRILLEGFRLYLSLHLRGVGVYLFLLYIGSLESNGDLKE